MNDASPAKPRRAGRLAAVTAAALGATLLAYPGGTAAAQTVDCDAYGPNPDPLRIGPALDLAVACDIEVRVASSSWHHATVTVTPDGQLHLVSTAEPTQMYEDYGLPEPALSEYDGSLTRHGANWSTFLRYTDQAFPLMETRAATLDWSGETPVPTFTGTTAVYDELAAGLDLSVDVGLSTVGLQFTAADIDAWNALSVGLRAVGTYEPVEAVDNSLRTDNHDGHLVEWTTPFTVRDAEGTTHQAHLSLQEGGAVMVELLDQTLAEAVFPLTLSTQWANRDDMVNEWGSVSSASPDLPLYRGEAGLDEPYFVASGQGADTIAGPYCDSVHGSDCTAAEAAAYWTFGSSVIDVQTPSVSYEFDYPVTSAVFTVDAAAGAECVAPDLDFTEGYSTATTWNQRPGVAGSAASGSCQDGTAVYDLTQPIAEAWGDTDTAEGITLATAETAQTARFDGGSARLEVYFDIAGINVRQWCSTDPANPDFYSYGVDYGLHVEGWREDLIDLHATWTAKVTDPGTGDTVLTTEPAPVLEENGSVGAIHSEFPQGSYTVEYEISSTEVPFTYVSPVCHFVSDNSNPSPEITVEPGQHRIGDTVSVEVALGEEDFANEYDSIVVYLQNRTDLGVLDSANLTGPGTAVVEAKLTSPVTRWWVQAEDRAGRDSLTSVEVAADMDFRDYNGDRLDDLVTVRKSDGALLLHAGKGDGTFAAGVSKATGWGGMDVVMAGDLTADGKADLLARDTKTGTLYTYPGNGSGGFGTRITAGSGWNALGVFTSGGDFNGDGDIDLFAVGKADGKLYFYDGQGNGSGKFNPRVALGTGWGVMDTIASVGDLTADGKADLLAHDSRTGQYYLYKGDGAGNLGSRVAIAASLDGSGSDRYSQIAAGGDFDRDGKTDIVAVDSRTGELELHSLNGNGTAVHSGRVIASTWGGNRLAGVNEERVYDYDGNGATDFVARRNSDGTTYLYPGTGTGTHGSRVSWGTALNGMTLIATAGDLNGDGFADVLARTSGGTLYLYPGTGTGALNTAGRVTIGTGWNAMSAITGGQDHNSDGKADVIAVHASTGSLYLYPGKGDGTFGSRITIGASGWDAMKEVTAVGDLDHDGRADLLAVRNADGCLYFYGGTGTGTLKSRVQIGCGWGGYDQITAVGDFNRDGHVDWMARRKSDGALFLYAGNGAGSYTARTSVGTGWNGMTVA